MNVESLARPAVLSQPTYEPGKPICGYFIRVPFPGDKLPVLICMGGLDSIKDEMWFMQAHGCLQRGISVLMIDGPGQGEGEYDFAIRGDYEVAVKAVVDYVLTRDDVDSIKGDWLTDNAIAFWEEYLEREKLSSYPKANIVLLRPSMSFMLQPRLRRVRAAETAVLAGRWARSCRHR